MGRDSLPPPLVVFASILIAGASLPQLLGQDTPRIKSHRYAKLASQYVVG